MLTRFRFLNTLSKEKGFCPAAGVPSAGSTGRSKMLALACSSFLVALLFVYLFMPGLLLSDDDTHESNLPVVAARNPFRESGPPANMAKLILLRHKIQSSNRKQRRNVTHSRQPSRTYAIPQARMKAPWIRFGRSFGKQYH